MTNPQGWPQWQRRRYTATVAAPAVNTEWTQTVPPGKVWEVLSIQASLVTDGNAATRQVSLSLTDPVVAYLVLGAFTTQLASLTRRYTWFPGAAPYAISTDIVSQTPPLIMQPGSVITSATASRQVGDQWSAVQINVIESTIGSQPVEVEGIPDWVAILAGYVTQYIPNIPVRDAETTVG
jgi:hypothetical protein